VNLDLFITNWKAARAHEALINTPLQRGGLTASLAPNRFNGLDSTPETAEAIRSLRVAESEARN
jgi:hypothetical protein